MNLIFFKRHSGGHTLNDKYEIPYKRSSCIHTSKTKCQMIILMEDNSSLKNKKAR